MTREEAIQCIKHELLITVNRKDLTGQAIGEALDMAIEALQERPTGRWVCRESCQVDEDAYDVAICSNCKAEITLEYPCDNYCPNCGARMDGEE